MNEREVGLRAPRLSTIKAAGVGFLAIWGAALSTFTVGRDFYRDRRTAARLGISAPGLQGIQPDGVTFYLINEGFEPVTVTRITAKLVMPELHDTLPVFVEPLPIRIDEQAFVTLRLDRPSVDEIALVVAAVPTSGTEVVDGHVQIWGSNPVFDGILHIAATSSMGTSVLRQPVQFMHTAYSDNIKERTPPFREDADSTRQGIRWLDPPGKTD